MRIKITLECTQETFIPFNYNTILAGIIYTTLSDKGYSNYLHENRQFKYFSISKLYLHKYRIDKASKTFRVWEGMSFIVSCPDTYFINVLLEGLLCRQYVYVKDQRLIVESVTIEDEVKFEEHMQYHTISPILVRTKREIDDKLRTYDLNPSEPDYFSNICDLVVKKYNQFYDVDKYSIEDITVSSSMRRVKGVRIAIRKGVNVTFNRAYYLDLLVDAPVELQGFLFDCGLGEKTAMAFGCLGLGCY